MAKRSQSKKKDGAKRTLNSAFGSVFRKIRRREPFASADVKLLQHHMYEALVTAAFSKCIEFNITVNRRRKNDDEAFVFFAGLRGVCEDLIFLAYMKRLSAEDRQELVQLLIQDSVAEGVEKQQGFFAANNPYQPVLSRKPRGDGKTHAELSAAEIKRFWSARHEPVRFKNPTAKHMAKSVGLESLYDYLYFATSNFVHFNPQTLLRMGWGDINQAFQILGEQHVPVLSVFRELLRRYPVFGLPCGLCV